MVRPVAPVGPAFADTAPVRLVFGALLRAAPPAVYRALAGAVEDLPEWFAPAVAAAPTPGGRQLRLKHGRQVWETVLTTEPGVRFACRADLTDLPGARALLEDWRLSPAGTGTRVVWTVATDGTAAYRVLVRAARPSLARAFRASVRALDRRLALPDTPAPGS